MLSFESHKGVRGCDGVTRREFLRAGALSAGAVGLSLAELAQLRGAGRSDDMSCILLMLVGGPSQLDTWDLKPKAHSNVRGPFRPIRTNVPGIDIGEHFPLMARMADRYALVRSVHHDSAPIHETGYQLMQTGRLFQNGVEHPHYGAVLSHLYGERKKGVPPFVVLPSGIDNTGVNVSHGQTASHLGKDHEPLGVTGTFGEGGFVIDGLRVGGVDPVQDEEFRTLVREALDAEAACLEGIADGAELEPLSNNPFFCVGPVQFGSPPPQRAFDLTEEPDEVRDRYGLTTFGQSCLLARRLVEHGVRLVTVNMFDTVFNNITWDCHADGGALASSLDDYKDTLCPMFDRAYSSLLDDLHRRGLLDTTLVVAMGEFGRTPELNPRGGRDHWPGVWTVLFAGGGVRGGRVVGSSDRNGAEPRDRPVTPAEVAATVYHALGVDLGTRLRSPGGKPMPLTDAEPIRELFAG